MPLTILQPRRPSRNSPNARAWQTLPPPVVVIANSENSREATLATSNPIHALMPRFARCRWAAVPLLRHDPRSRFVWQHVRRPRRRVTPNQPLALDHVDDVDAVVMGQEQDLAQHLSLIHISEPTRRTPIS